MRNFDQSFYNSRRWRRTTDLYLKSVSGLCEICKAEGTFTPAAIVHHKDHLTEEDKDNEEKKFSFENLQAVCLRHHNEIHFKSKKRYFVDKDGHVHANR